MSNHLLKQIIRHEGSRNQMYLDSEDIETIGVGHNLRDRPISDRANELAYQMRTGGY